MKWFSDKFRKRVNTYREQLFLVVVMLAGSFLFFANLHNQYLWQDEAQSALLAETILERGMPYGTDGKNFFSQELGAEYGKDYIWKWHTWLPFYLVAISFKLFGITTFAARLPFAFLGLATLPLVYFFSLNLWHNKRSAAITVILLLFCVPFLLLSRQCRYYSAASFFSLLVLFSYIHVTRGRRWAIGLFALSNFALFQVHYVYTACLLLTVVIHCLCFHRERWLQVLVATGVTLLICFPWIVWLSDMQYNKNYGDNFFDLSHHLSSLLRFVTEIQHYVFPIHVMAFPIVLSLLFKFRGKPAPRLLSEQTCSNLAVPILFILVTLVVLSITAPTGFFRYLCPLIPVILVIGGFIIEYTFRFHRAAGVLAMLMALSIYPIHSFLYELTHDYDGPIEGIVKYLNDHARADDTVLITYGDLPLKFYTDCRVIGGLTGEDLNLAAQARWVIMRRYIININDHAVFKFISNRFDVRKYRKIDLNYPDLPFENRESPNEHHFRTVDSAPSVVISERIR